MGLSDLTLQLIAFRCPGASDHCWGSWWHRCGGGGPPGRQGTEIRRPPDHRAGRPYRSRRRIQPDHLRTRLGEAGGRRRTTVPHRSDRHCRRHPGRLRRPACPGGASRRPGPAGIDDVAAHGRADDGGVPPGRQQPVDLVRAASASSPSRRSPAGCCSTRSASASHGRHSGSSPPCCSWRWRRAWSASFSARPTPCWRRSSSGR